MGDVRGRGLFAAIELVRDREAREPFEAEQKAAERLLAACQSRGVSFYAGGGMADGRRGDHLQIAPPFIITREEIDKIVGVLEEGLNEVAEALLD